MRKLIIIFLSSAKSIASSGFNFLIALLGIHFFGKEQWGSIIEILIWIYFIVFLINWGHKDYLLRIFSTNPSKIYNAFSINLSTRLVLLPVSFLLFIFFPLQIALLSILLIFILACYQALDSLIIYHQKFGPQLIFETLSFIIIASSIITTNSFSLSGYLMLLIIANAIKLIGVISVLKLWNKPLVFKVYLSEFAKAKHFFFIGFSGWLTSKIDIYIVDYFLPKETLAEYQLLITSFLMLQSIAGLIMIPYTKHFYRLSVKSIKRIKLLLQIVALVVVCLGSFCIWVVLEYFLKLEIETDIYILGALSSIPSFLYIANILEFFKYSKEKIVTKINFLSAGLNAILLIFLIKNYQIFGVFLGLCITQWILLLFYKIYAKTKMPDLQRRATNRV